MVQGSISMSREKDLFVLHWTINAGHYLSEIQETHMIPTVEQHGELNVFYVTAFVTNFLAEWNVEIPTWPLKSPDL